MGKAEGLTEAIQSGRTGRPRERVRASGDARRLLEGRPRQNGPAMVRNFRLASAKGYW